MDSELKAFLVYNLYFGIYYNFNNIPETVVERYSGKPLTNGKVFTFTEDDVIRVMGEMPKMPENLDGLFSVWTDMRNNFNSIIGVK